MKNFFRFSGLAIVIAAYWMHENATSFWFEQANVMYTTPSWMPIALGILGIVVLWMAPMWVNKRELVWQDLKLFSGKKFSKYYVEATENGATSFLEDLLFQTGKIEEVFEAMEFILWNYGKTSDENLKKVFPASFQRLREYVQESFDKEYSKSSSITGMKPGDWCLYGGEHVIQKMITDYAFYSTSPLAAKTIVSIYERLLNESMSHTLPGEHSMMQFSQMLETLRNTLAKHLDDFDEQDKIPDLAKRNIAKAMLLSSIVTKDFNKKDLLFSILESKKDDVAAPT